VVPWRRRKQQSLKAKNKMNAIELGKTVTRIASDYTNGRIGRVIELDSNKSRARVSWESTAAGTPMKLRTWVRFSDLKVS
jgi:transcription antitermination factor NusG